jgi:hypothetical protein
MGAGSTLTMTRPLAVVADIAVRTMQPNDVIRTSLALVLINPVPPTVLAVAVLVKVGETNADPMYPKRTFGVNVHLLAPVTPEAV